MGTTLSGFGGNFDLGGWSNWANSMAGVPSPTVNPADLGSIVPSGDTLSGGISPPDSQKLINALKGVGEAVKQTTPGTTPPPVGGAAAGQGNPAAFMQLLNLMAQRRALGGRQATNVPGLLGG